MPNSARPGALTADAPETALEQVPAAGAETQPVPSAEVAPARQPKQRSMLIDVVRGVAISLVVIGHTNEGMLHRGWWLPSPVGLHIDSTIYAFHMPAFFFVSGIFLRPGVEKRGFSSYAVDRMRVILYPYFLWAFLTLATQPLVGRFMLAGPVSTSDSFLLDLLEGVGAWFLPTLFLAVLAGALLRRLTLWPVFLVSVLAELYLPATHINEVDLMFRHLPFLILGMWVGKSFERLEALPRWVSALGGAGLLLLLVRLTDINHFRERTWVVPLGILGTAMLLLLAHALGRGRLSRSLAWTGEASLAVYLISSYLQGAGRLLLVSVFHTHAPWPQLIFPSLVAIAIPPWIYQHRFRLHLNWLFVWPFQRKTA